MVFLINDSGTFGEVQLPAFPRSVLITPLIEFAPCSGGWVDRSSENSRLRGNLLNEYLQPWVWKGDLGEGFLPDWK